MSRSYKKPYVTLCGYKQGEMKKWKKTSNQVFRRIKADKEISNGKYYKKVNDIWSAPCDGKKWYCDEPKWRRK